ncbi:probable signal peptidase complex subunit 2 [Phtheirospermum japonicum]|uniref:Signal peptidase complex subunit 2 n=1 Tax=Phtheirospermum japonicum TaxID=374723 RepID=A0A830BRB0_9LAMI|nr:probable signal peptidase complex subunit 2 [Phtheirospermum japonicum]
MQEKKVETATNKNPKKANLLDHHSIKHILDESVTEIVTSKGYPEDVRLSNIRLLIGVIIIVIALFAQFYNKKFPENRNFFIGCIGIQWDITADYIPQGKECNDVHLSSSNLYTLSIASADPKSVSAKPPVEFTKSVTKWFTKEGVLVEGLLWKDVEGLINEYAKESKKSK